MKKLISLLGALFCCCMLSTTFVEAQTTGEIAKGNCKACAQTCKETLDYCKKKGGRYAETNLTNALKDCIDACHAAEGCLSRGSSMQTKFASACVEACNTCAKSCESFKDDNNMKACADECRKCAGNCSKIKSAE